MDLPTAMRDLLDRPLAAIISTTDDLGDPQASIVWFERQGNDVVFFCRADSIKASNLAQRPQVVAIVVDPDREFEPGAPCYVRISGRASIRPLVDLSLPNRLARRYMGVDEFPHRGDYVSVHVATDRASGVGPYPGTPHDWGE